MQDIHDRVAERMGQSTLTGRMSQWQMGVNMLPPRQASQYNWPSKRAMNTVRELSNLQLKFNTWWDIEYDERTNTYAAKQPREHPGYRDHDTSPPDIQMPFFIINKPEERQLSEYVKYLCDAILFLDIKAKESQITFNQLLDWFARPSEDSWVDRLEYDLVCEFQRWRQGCPDSPSVDCFRTTLDSVRTAGRRVLIYNLGCYEDVPELLDVYNGLISEKEARRKADEEVRAVIAARASKRVANKLRAEKAGGVEAEGEGAEK